VVELLILEEEVVEVAVVAEEAAIVEIEEVAVVLHPGAQGPDSHLPAVVDLLPCRVKK
jgi:hypothetical protein